MPSPAEALPVLDFPSLRPGRTFGPTTLRVEDDLISEFIDVTGDDNPLYGDRATAVSAGLSGPVVPPGLSGVWARLAYVSGFRLPPGGVMAGQDYRFFAPIPVGTALTLDAEVLEADPEDPKRRVVIGCRARAGDRILATVEIDARWGVPEA